MSLIPENVRRQVIIEIYKRADNLDWDGLSPSDRSTWYVRWLDDPAIGGTLDPYMPRDKARMWIKDVPMKHYARARSGIGPYAGLVSSCLPGAAQLAKLAFGSEWLPVEGTVQEKPNRCIISDGHQQAEMIWGPPRAIQSLVWASLNAAIDNHPVPVIVVVTRQGQRLTDGQLDRHRRIACQVGAQIRHITVGAVKRDVMVDQR